MFTLAILCFVIYLGAYFCLKTSKEPMGVEPIHSMEDLFINYHEQVKTKVKTR